jgi:hypothetical protein
LRRLARLAAQAALEDAIPELARRLQRTRRRQATQAADHLVLPAARAAAAGQNHGDCAKQSRWRRHRPQQP